MPSIDQYWLQPRTFYDILAPNIDRYTGQSASFEYNGTDILLFSDGTSRCDEAIEDALRDAIERHIVEKGVRDFLVGHYGAFDHLSARIVMEMKKRYPAVRLTLLLPYHPLPNEDALPNGFDGSLYPFDRHVPPRAAIVQANRWAIRRCGYMICYARHFGKSREYLEFAQRRAARGLIEITNLGTK